MDTRISLIFFFTILMSVSSQKIVILGGGIHGVSLSYFLAQRGLASIIVEKTSIAAAASGKAGGFLAKNWGSGPTVQLHKISYDLHKELASSLNIESYRQVNTLSADGNKKGKSTASWLDKKVSSSLMDVDTAQVTPKEFTEKVLEAALAKGVEVVIDSAEEVLSEGGKITGVRQKNRGILETNKVVVCLGPWSGVKVEDWFGLNLPMDGVKSTSLVYNDLEIIRKEPFAAFCAEDNNGCHLELYPRPNGELYICGCGGSDYVSGDRLRENGDCASADLIKPDPKRVAAAKSSLEGMSSMVGKSPDVTQACMRPCTPDALPVMGEIPGFEGAYISCGHNCWGILWAPVSGLCMAELIADGKSTTVDLRALLRKDI